MLVVAMILTYVYSNVVAFVEKFKEKRLLIFVPDKRIILLLMKRTLCYHLTGNWTYDTNIVLLYCTSVRMNTVQ